MSNGPEQFLLQGQHSSGIGKPSCLVCILSPPLSQQRTWPRKGNFGRTVPLNIYPPVSQLGAESCGCLQSQNDGDPRDLSTLRTPIAPAQPLHLPLQLQGCGGGSLRVWEGSACRAGSEEQMRQVAPGPLHPPFPDLLLWVPSLGSFH